VRSLAPNPQQNDRIDAEQAANHAVADHRVGARKCVVVLTARVEARNERQYRVDDVPDEKQPSEAETSTHPDSIDRAAPAAIMLLAHP
jgi:hypothetical protein